MTEIGHRGNQSLSEVSEPEVVDGDAGGQRIFLTGNPSRQGQASARTALGVQLSDRCVFFAGRCQSSRRGFKLLASRLHFLFPGFVRLIVSRLRQAESLSQFLLRPEQVLFPFQKMGVTLGFSGCLC